MLTFADFKLPSQIVLDTIHMLLQLLSNKGLCY